MVQHVDELFPVLLKVLSDSADEVVQQDLEVLAEIMSYPLQSMPQTENLCIYKYEFY